MSDLQLVASNNFTGATQSYTTHDGQTLVVTYANAQGSPAAGNIVEFYRRGECAFETVPYYKITFGQGIEIQNPNAPPATLPGTGFDKVIGIWVNETTQHVLVAYLVTETPSQYVLLATYDTSLPQGSNAASIVKFPTTLYQIDAEYYAIDAAFNDCSRVVAVASTRPNPTGTSPVTQLHAFTIPELAPVGNVPEVFGTLEYVKAFQLHEKDYAAVFVQHVLPPDTNLQQPNVNLQNDVAEVFIYTFPDMPKCEPCIITGGLNLVDGIYIPGHQFLGIGGVSTVKEKVAIIAFGAVTGFPSPSAIASPVFLLTFDGHKLHYRGKVSAPGVLVEIQPTSDGKGFVAVTNDNTANATLNTYRLKDKCDNLILKAGQGFTLNGKAITNATLNDVFEPATFNGRYITVTTTTGQVNTVQVFKVLSCKC